MGVSTAQINDDDAAAARAVLATAKADIDAATALAATAGKIAATALALQARAAAAGAADDASMQSMERPAEQGGGTVTQFQEPAAIMVTTEGNCVVQISSADGGQAQVHLAGAADALLWTWIRASPQSQVRAGAPSGSRACPPADRL